MKPIWYFVGILLLIMGSIIVLAGLYRWAYPSTEQKILAFLQPDIWCGGNMVITGLIFLLINRKKTVG